MTWKIISKTNPFFDMKIKEVRDDQLGFLGRGLMEIDLGLKLKLMIFLNKNMLNTNLEPSLNKLRLFLRRNKV